MSIYTFCTQWVFAHTIAVLTEELKAWFLSHGLSQPECRGIYHPGSVLVDLQQQFIQESKDTGHTPTPPARPVTQEARTNLYNILKLEMVLNLVPASTQARVPPHAHTHIHINVCTHAEMRKSNYQLAFLSQSNLMHWVRASRLCLVITLSLL